eukprot:CAMPEP_0115751334 /NCGR_PEP_ID=MMETSP0272-20121206/95213_1 /TAXON_ID=71861 /ORGANISM="Scrippsiella trochoidea, Strain CCMP3099" /LENGTH=75 /DNA_ID=CAMNT_0003196531 /DNA_START=299 /DNA_END=526 /DNA_ORIENTATION=+
MAREGAAQRKRPQPPPCASQTALLQQADGACDRAPPRLASASPASAARPQSTGQRLTVPTIKIRAEPDQRWSLRG